MKEPNSDPMLEVRSLSKRFSSGPPAVDSVSFSVAAGELVVLLGESGCGKTTTLKMINRLLESDSGEILLEGRNVSELSPVQVRRRIGYVFQGVGLFPHMTVSQNIGITPELMGWNTERLQKRVTQLLELVRLSPQDYAERFPRELSGGQCQRVGFARALASSPRLLLLDEPFGALDPVTRDLLQREFREIQQRLNLAALMVTHDIMEALLLADRVLIMQQGRILQAGTPCQVFNSPRGDFVSLLMETPRRQAQRLECLFGSD